MVHVNRSSEFRHVRLQCGEVSVDRDGYKVILQHQGSGDWWPGPQEWGDFGNLWRESDYWRMSGSLVTRPSFQNETTQTRARTTVVLWEPFVMAPGPESVQNLSGPMIISIILTSRSSPLCPWPVSAVSALKAHLRLLSRHHLGTIVSCSNLSFPP